MHNSAQQTGALPDSSAERKTYPLYRGLFQYFPRALAAVAHHSYVNNEKHNPGEPLHWSREKSADHADCLLRHVMEGDWVSVTWRALAKLELVLEDAAVEPDCPVGDYKLPPEPGRSCATCGRPDTLTKSEMFWCCGSCNSWGPNWIAKGD